MATRRTAMVRLQNNTGRTIKVLSLRHQGRDGLRHDKQWSDVIAEATTPAFEVAYEMGLAVTGADYWLLAWVYADGEEVFFTDPDVLAEESERAVEKITAIAPDFAKRFNSAFTGVAAEEIIEAITDEVVTAARRSGWHSHPLTKAEFGRTMRIDIEPNNDVVFESRSQQSRTPAVSTRLKRPADGPRLVKCE